MTGLNDLTRVVNCSCGNDGGHLASCDIWKRTASTSAGSSGETPSEALVIAYPHETMNGVTIKAPSGARPTFGALSFALSFATRIFGENVTDPKAMGSLAWIQNNLREILDAYDGRSRLTECERSFDEARRQLALATKPGPCLVEVHVEGCYCRVHETVWFGKHAPGTCTNRIYSGIAPSRKGDVLVAAAVASLRGAEPATDPTP